MAIKLKKAVVELAYAIATQYPHLSYASLLSQHFTSLTTQKIIAILLDYNTLNHTQLFNINQNDFSISVDTTKIPITLDTRIDLSCYEFNCPVLSLQFNGQKNWFLLPLVIIWLEYKGFMYMEDIVSAFERTKITNIQTNNAISIYDILDLIDNNSKILKLNDNYLSLQPNYLDEVDHIVNLPKDLYKLKCNSKFLMRLDNEKLFTHIIEMPVYLSQNVWCAGNLMELLQYENCKLHVNDLQSFFCRIEIEDSIKKWNLQKETFYIIKNPDNTKSISMNTEYNGSIHKCLKWKYKKYQVMPISTISCKICYESQHLMLTKCGHVICENCLQCINNDKCPFCISHINVEDMYKIYI